MPYPEQTFSTFDELRTYINEFWITNGNQEITGVIGNNVVNGNLTFITKSPLNWQKAQIIATTGVVSAARPVVVFMTSVPSQLNFPNNIYNEYVFINTTSGNIPLGTPTQYYDINLNTIDNIPAKSIVNIVRTNNDSWIVASVPSSGSLASLPPLIGIVDGGEPNDPVSGISTYQNNALIGLGASNNGRIQIQIDNGILSNYGVNQSIDFDTATGIIDLNYNSSGNTWQTGSSLYVDLNQK